MKFSMLTLAVLLFISCNGGGGASVASESADLQGFTSTEMAGSNAVYSEKKDGAGKIVESGYTVNGKKNGTWIKNNQEGGKIQFLTSYVDGQLNGPTLEFDTRGQVIKRSDYKAGVFDGIVATYKFGRVEKSTPYVNGVIEGTYEEFNGQGKIQKMIEFKNGKQDGALKYYDDQGNVTLEYVYKNGEKVSGGIIE